MRGFLEGFGSDFAPTFASVFVIVTKFKTRKITMYTNDYKLCLETDRFLSVRINLGVKDSEIIP